jgi:HEAT repeat protein
MRPLTTVSKLHRHARRRAPARRRCLRALRALGRSLEVLAALAVLVVVPGCAGHERLRQDDPQITEHEVREAGEDDDPALTAHLHRIVTERDRYPAEVVVAALGAIAERKDPTSPPVVARLEHDPDEEVRFHTALALRALGGPEAKDVLARMAKDDPSPLVREEAAK